MVSKAEEEVVSSKPAATRVTEGFTSPLCVRQRGKQEGNRISVSSVLLVSTQL